MNLFDVYPLNDVTIVKAKDSYVWDENGVQYLDMYGGHAVISIDRELSIVNREFLDYKSFKNFVLSLACQLLIAN